MSKELTMFTPLVRIELSMNDCMLDKTNSKTKKMLTLLLVLIMTMRTTSIAIMTTRKALSISRAFNYYDGFRDR